MVTGMLEGKRDSERPREVMPDSSASGHVGTSAPEMIGSS